MIRWCLSHSLCRSVRQTICKQNYNNFVGRTYRACGVNGMFTKPDSHTKKVCSLFTTVPKTITHDETSPKNKLEKGNTVPVFTTQNELEDWATKQLENLSPDDERKLKILKLEYDSFFSLGKKVPSQVTNDQWLELLQKNSVRARLKLYKFWLLRENWERKKEEKKIINIQKEEAKLAERAVKNEKRDPDDFSNIRYLLFIRKQTMLSHYYNNLYNAMKFGPHILFDFGFEDFMTQKELTNLISQMQLVHGCNKVHREPFHIIMCNVQPDQRYSISIQKKFTGLSMIPFTVTDKHYLDLFPKEQLVYLSPNASNKLKAYNPHDVYIVGGIVDTSNEEPLTLAKAKRDGIRAAQLPLDLHLDWAQGSKSLPLPHVMSILLTLRDTGDWQQAFQHIPGRKLKGYIRKKRHLEPCYKHDKKSVS